MSDSTYADASAVVTGAGFIGSRLVRELLARGAAVTVLTLSPDADRTRLGEAAEDVRWVEVDLVDGEAVREALVGVDPAFVFHLAGVIDMSPAADPRRLVDGNVTASANVVAACAGLDSLRLAVSTGTCAEYGDLREPATEDSPVAPNNLYGVTKAAGVLVARQIAEERGVPLAVLRPYNLYGEHEAPARLLPHVVLSLLAGREVPLTEGEQTKDYLYVGDLAQAFLAAGASAEAAAGQVFNIGSGESVTLREFVTSVARALGADESLLRFGAVPYRENEMWRQGTSTAKAEALLGWRPSQSLAEGLAITVGWYRENRGLYGG